MKNRTLMVVIILSVLFVIFAIMPGYTQEDVTTASDSAFQETMRPSVSFLHDEHNEKAQIDECNRCHHVFEEGKKVEDESSEDMECSECHTLESGENPMPLVKLYHKNCKECHLESKAGPIMCGECHKKQN